MATCGYLQKKQMVTVAIKIVFTKWAWLCEVLDVEIPNDFEHFKKFAITLKHTKNTSSAL
jgi:hypothetical protein